MAITNAPIAAAAGRVPAAVGAATRAVASPSVMAQAANAGAPPNYQQQFQSALQAARGNISAQLGAALGDIASNQQAAGQALQTLPGGINAAYNQQQGTVNSALGAIEGAQHKSGIGSLMPVSAFMQPEMAAVQGSRQASLANVPLLQLGIQQQAAGDRARAELAAQGDQSSLNQMVMQSALQGQQSQLGYQNNLSLQNAEDAARLKEIQAQKDSSSPTVTNAQGVPQGYTQADMKKAIASPQYARASQLIQSNAGNPQQLAQVWADLQNEYRQNPALIQALVGVLPGGKQPGSIATGPAQPSGMSQYLDLHRFL